MKLLAKLSLIAAVLALALAAATFPVEASYASRAQLMQRMQKSAGDDLFGDQGTPIGSPQKFIVDDPKAILKEKGENGITLLDENYLVKNSIHPLQMQTVSYVAGLVRMGGGVAGVLLLLVTLALRAKLNVAAKDDRPKAEPAS